MPFWPLGLPGRRDDWLALALDTGEATLVAGRRRGGAEERVIRMSGGRARGARCLNASVPVRLDTVPEGLRVGFTHPVSAAVVRIPSPSARLS
ncbi:hypothetical protein [Streptomyces sp. AC550_RSS872]|uniref:hypothetical protein n=1 Tax=Streptomyces sp. AC550_RSS872 TaxID=2823689 RepID=UPI001C26BBDB|nr:hypothetical protein [Streptomyces sp. AC550_RSS872]